MPIIGATWATLNQVIAELEQDGNTVMQIVSKPGDQVAVLYQQSPTWETRDSFVREAYDRLIDAAKIRSIPKIDFDNPRIDRLK
jgi:hypothetical protein